MARAYLVRVLYMVNSCCAFALVVSGDLAGTPGADGKTEGDALEGRQDNVGLLRDVLRAVWRTAHRHGEVRLID